MIKLKAHFIATLALSVLVSACGDFSFQSKSKKTVSRITSDQFMVDEKLGDENVSFPVYSNKVLLEKIKTKEVVPVSLQGLKSNLKLRPQNKSVAPQDTTLMLALPVDLIGEEYIFGSVITKVSVSDNADLGGLKLTDLPALHVRLQVAQDNGKAYLVLVGCAFDCNEDSEQAGFFALPIEGHDVENNAFIINLANLAQSMELIRILDSKKIRYGVDVTGSETTTMEYSKSSLVFDVKTKIVPTGKNPLDPATPKAELTARWYLKLTSTFNSAFTPRSPVAGAGFFQTERAKDVRITRFAIPNSDRKIHYFIKNVPTEHKATFAGSFDHWNAVFKEVAGREVLSYEFIDKDDAKAKLIVAGDIRYNVMEWDLDNLASYGGLGPSIANQFTGEIQSANVLIQGPKILEMYTKWFKVSETARALVADGKEHEANALMASFNKEMLRTHGKKASVFGVSFGSGLAMSVASQRPELEDPLYKGEFDLVPKGVTFESYMKGYFTEMLQHELGHNFGLRHNFKGNLGATMTGERGSVSRSIMEYLGRHSRHLNDIGEYDKMAIAYAYKGVTPVQKNWFCTDQDGVSNHDVDVTPWTPEIMIKYGQTPVTVEELKTTSAECTKADATLDPYSFWESRLSRGLELLLETKTAGAPLWKLDEIKKEMNDMILGFANYSLGAEKTASTWTNFFGKDGRPESKEGVPAYVLESFKKQLCSENLKPILAAKESQEARSLAEANLNQLKDLVTSKLVFWTLLKEGQSICE